MKKIFSFDAETNGLWGTAFSIGAVILKEDGMISEQFVARCPIEGATDAWVQENVLPEMVHIPVTHENYKSMLEDFMAFYMENKKDAEIIVHMGLPVEAKLFLDAHKMGVLGDWDAPYPLIDICAFPAIGTSVDSYNRKHGILVPEYTGDTHNPLYDSAAAALAYLHYKKKRERRKIKFKL